MTKRELDALRQQIEAGFAALREDLKATLPREVYAVNQRQVEADITDIQARLQKLETTTVDLNTQLLSLKQVTPVQISGSATQIRYEAVNRTLDAFSRIALMVGGALVSFLAYTLANHH